MTDPNASHLARCFRCRRPINNVRKREEPTICGQCRHDIHETQGRAGVEAYKEAMRRAQAHE